MRRLTVALIATAVFAATVAGCSSQAPATPTQAPAPKAAAPTTAPAAAAPTTAPAPAAPTVAPTAVPAPKVTFPEKGKPITLIVPWPAGGGTDIGGRVLAAGLEKELGTPVNVVNKAGASSQVGITDLTNAKPDGYTVAYVSLPGGLVTYLDPDRKATYTRKSIQPLVLHSIEPGTVAVANNSPYKSLTDMINAAKANPNSVKMAIAGIMTAGHLELVQLQQMTGAKFSLVQFDGAAPAMTAVVGGHVDGYISSISDDLPSVKGGNARVLGVADSARSKILPDVPTFKEQGYDLNAYLSTGLIAPAGTPKDVLAAISAAAKKVIATDEHKAKLVEIGKDGRYMDVADFEKFWDDLEASTAKLMPLAKADAK